MALRLARAYTGRKRVIKFEDHFHGWNDYVLTAPTTALGVPAETWATTEVLPTGEIHLVEACLRERGDVAAVILEPTGSHMGQVPTEPSFLRELREATARHQAVRIFDEVVTEFRVSPGGAQALYGVTLDLTTLVKILGGGLPAGRWQGERRSWT